MKIQLELTAAEVREAITYYVRTKHSGLVGDKMIKVEILQNETDPAATVVLEPQPPNMHGGKD